MDQATYNAKIQEIQEMWGEHSRVRPVYRDEVLVSAVFEVDWDGHWHRIGVEEFPMSPKVTRTFDEVLATRLMAEFAHALATS